MTVELHPMTLDEAQAYFDLFRSPSVCRHMDILPFTCLDDSHRFLQFADQQRTNRKSLRYSIRVDGSFAGTLCLYAIYWHQKRASVGYALKEDRWSQGVMTEALRLLEVLAEQELALHRLQATVLPANRASGRLLQKCGYTLEGVLNHYEIWEGRGFVDLELYSKLLSPSRRRACAAILDASHTHILMVKHSHNGRTYWTLPGGGLEPGETFEQAAIREAKEETGLEVKIVMPIFDETYDHEGRAALSRCFLVSHRPGQTARLGHDPEQITLGPGNRMLQDLAWRPLADLSDDVQVSRVIEFLMNR